MSADDVDQTLRRLRTDLDGLPHSYDMDLLVQGEALAVLATAKTPVPATSDIPAITTPRLTVQQH